MGRRQVLLLVSKELYQSRLMPSIAAFAFQLQCLSSNTILVSLDPTKCLMNVLLAAGKQNRTPHVLVKGDLVNLLDSEVCPQPLINELAVKLSSAS